MEILLRLFGVLNKIVNFLITPVLFLIYDAFGKHEKLPPIRNPILELAAVDVAEKIRNREVKHYFQTSFHSADRIRAKFLKAKTLAISISPWQCHTGSLNPTDS